LGGWDSLNKTISYEVKKATTADSAAIIKILKDRATLLKEQGSTQWNFLLTGLEDEEIVRNVEAGLFYKVVDQAGGNTVATFLLSQDQDEWDVNLWGKDDGNGKSSVLLLAEQPSPIRALDDSRPIQPSKS